MIYGKETIKIEDITATLFAHDMKKKNRKDDVDANSHVEGLVVRGEIRNGQGAESTSKNKKKVQCKDWGHMKRAETERWGMC